MTVLVTGARGHVGRHVVEQLLGAGVQVRASSHERHSARAASRTGGAEVVDIDLTQPKTLEPALDGVTKVFLYGQPEGVDRLIAATRAAGVRHVVLLSSASVAASNADSNPIAQHHLAVERALTDSGIPSTFLRPAAFATNSLQWAKSIRAERVVRAPYPDAYLAPIHERDIASVAVALLTGDGHGEGPHFLTGPQSIHQRHQVELIANALGQPLRFEELPPEQAREQMSTVMPSGVADTVLGYFAITDGKPGTVTDTVRQITGRPARTFAQWAADHVADFR